MSEIRYPEGPGTPLASPPPAPPAPGTAQQPGADEQEATPTDAPWQATVIRVSALVAIWLGY